MCKNQLKAARSRLAVHCQPITHKVTASAVLLLLGALSLSLLATRAQAQAPGLLWTTNIGARLFAVDVQTNVYANIGGTVIKLNSAGVPFQTNSICPRPGLAQRDADGNYYFAGVLPSHSVPPGILVFDSQDFGGVVLTRPVYIAKYSSLGTLLWATNGYYNSAVRSVEVTDLSLDESGNLFIGYGFNIYSTGYSPLLTKLNTSGTVLWSVETPGDHSIFATFGGIRMGAISPTNGFVLAYASFSGAYRIILSQFDINGTATGVGGWEEAGSSGAHAARSIRNRLAEVYNVEHGQLTKRTAAGDIVWQKNGAGPIQWAVGQDQWDGVHVGSDNGELSRYDYDGNRAWTITFPSPCDAMVLDSQGNRFVSLLNGTIARIGGEPLSAPVITNSPQGQTVFSGSNAVVTVGASGTTPLRYYWRLYGTNIPNATNATLAFNPATPSQSGSYQVVVSNHLGSVTSAPALLRVKSVAFYLGNQLLTNGTYTFASPPTLSIRSTFTNGSSFYTLDGSPPSFASIPYAGPFPVSSNATARAIGYSADFFQSEEADAVNVVLPPSYTLTVGTVGPGSVRLNPTGGVYIASTVVTVTATPSAGWVFHHWAGDAGGTSPSINVVMTESKNVQAVFGTTLSTTVAGNGQVQPAGGVYAYGSIVRLSAIPQPGNYFGVWGNAASGNSNPLYFPITNSNPTVSSLFAATPAGQAALTVLINGPGSINVNPPGNVFATNQSVILTAIPYNGQGFISWSGDASGTQNPLTIGMTQSRIITANFTNWPVLVANQKSFTVQGFRFSLLSGPGLTYQVQGSTNLFSWVNLGVVTNATGETQFTDPAGTNLPLRFYRATSWP